MTMTRSMLKYGALALGLVAAAPVAMAQGAGQGPDTSANKIAVYTGARLDAGMASELVARARARGEIRVIVGLDLALRDEDGMDTAQRAAQAARLRSMQDAVVASLGAGAASRAVRFDLIPFVSVWADAGQIQSLIANPGVVSIEQDIPVPPSLADSVPLIQAPKVWAKGYDGTNSTVAVLDTGADNKHQMLASRIVDGACYSTNNGANIVSLCPGGVTEKKGIKAGRNCDVAIPGCDHGTHVASTVAGTMPTLKGVAPDADLVSMQVFTRFNLDADCGGAGTAPCVLSYTTDQVKGLERVAKLRKTYPMAAVNMSLGGGAYSATCDALNPAQTAIIAKLRTKGIATVIAAGNNGYSGWIGSPACISQAIAVGSSTKTDVVSSFSNHSPLVKVMAPGSDISAAQAGSHAGLTVKSGTSMATPHVAGAFALLNDFKPNATVGEIATALICTGKPVERAGYNVKKPRIQLLNAWTYLKRPPNAPITWSFDSAGDADDWSALLGTWGIASGAYTLLTQATGIWNASWFPNCNENITVDATMRRVDDQTSSFHYNSGLILKATVDEATKSVSGYWFAYNDLDWDEGTPKLGDAVIWRMDGFNLSANSGGAALLCIAHDVGVKEGGVNTLNVVSNGASHVFTLNGTQVCSANDATYTSGSLGLVVAMPHEGTQSFRVDQASLTPTRSPATVSASGGVIHPAQFAPVPVPEGASPLGQMRR